MERQSEFDIERSTHGRQLERSVQYSTQLGLGEDLRRARRRPQYPCWKSNHARPSSQDSKVYSLGCQGKAGLASAARNLPGVDVVAAKDLCAEDFAPGGDWVVLPSLPNPLWRHSTEVISWNAYDIISNPGSQRSPWKLVLRGNALNSLFARSATKVKSHELLKPFRR